MLGIAFLIISAAILKNSIFSICLVPEEISCEGIFVGGHTNTTTDLVK